MVLLLYSHVHAFSKAFTHTNSLSLSRPLLSLPPPPRLLLLAVKVVTDKHLYRLDNKTFKIHKHPIPLEEVEGFGVSTGEDQACIIRLQGQTDLVLTLRGDACAAELVSLITQARGHEYVTVLRACRLWWLWWL